MTGVRFKEERKSIFLQIRVGKLLPMGFIESKTDHWMSIPSDAKESDFATISYDDIQSYIFCLGEEVNKFDGNQVVTGKELENCLESIYSKLFKAIQLTHENAGGRDVGILFQVYGKTLLSFENGTLGSDWFYHRQLPTPYKRLGIGKKVGIKPQNSNFVVSKNVWIVFRKSDEETDAGQSFVPYFDPTEATFDPPAPLSTIELVHYTNDPNYAGYVRPMIKSIDYRKFIGT